MENFFGTNFWLCEGFPQFCSYLYILFSLLVLILESDSVLQSHREMLLKIMKSRGINRLLLLLVLLALLLLRVRILLFWLLVDHGRRWRWSESWVWLASKWRRWLLFAQKLIDVIWRISAFEIGNTLKTLTISIFEFILTHFAVLLLQKNVAVWVLFWDFPHEFK